MRRLISVMLLFVFLSTLFTPIAASSYFVEVFPISHEMRRFPLKIYIHPETTCPPEVYNLFTEILKNAIRNFNRSVDAFTQQYPGRFDALTLLKPVLTNREDEASIIVVFKQLGEGPAGYAELPLADGHLVPKPRINYDCEVVSRPTVPPINVILHELLHGYGLGHANFDELNGFRELMSTKGRPEDPIIYPSSLDLYALHLIWFENYKGKNVELPPWLEYKMVMPGTVPRGLEEFEKRLTSIEREVQKLNSTALSLSDDIRLIHMELKEVRRRIEELEIGKSVLEKEVGELSEQLKAQEERVRGLEVRASIIPRLEADVEKCEAEVDELRRQMLEERAQLQAEVEALKGRLEEVSKLSMIMFVVIIVLVGISISALTIALLKKRQT